MAAPLDGLIFDAVYGSWILSLLLFTLVYTEDFSMRHYAVFSQIGSHIVCVAMWSLVTYSNCLVVIY